MGILLCNIYMKNAILPKIITNGLKHLSVESPICNIRIIDSLNLLPSSWSRLPKMFGIKNEIKKGYFPHLFYRTESQTACLDHLPDQQCYNSNRIKPEEKSAFREWYSKHQNDPFDFQTELLEYCRSNVDILHKCCLQFRKLFMEITSKDHDDPGVDPFAKCITIASACQYVYQRNFLEPDAIGLIPAQGYNPLDKHSIKAIQWLKYYAHTHSVDIRHARNGSEVQVGDYKLDGFYIGSDGEKVALEFNGCIWHGCPKCY